MTETMATAATALVTRAEPDDGESIQAKLAMPAMMAPFTSR